MEFLQPTSWEQALEVKAEHPDAVPLSGGTDVMVELNFDRARPGALLDLTHVPGLSDWSEHDGVLRLGAGLTYAQLMTELADRLPAPYRPAGLRLTATEGAGEVQTPVTGRAAARLRIGDRVWFRHAKAGELAERFDHYQLVEGARSLGSVPTYRGEGRSFG